MKRRLLVISVLGTYFLLTWGIGHNKVIEDDHELIRTIYVPLDDELSPNSTESDVSTNDTNVSDEIRKYSPSISFTNLTSDVDKTNSVTLMSTKNASTDPLEINSTGNVDLIRAKSVKSNKYHGPPYHVNLSSKTQQAMDARQTTGFGDERPPFEIQEGHQTPDPRNSGNIQGPQQINYNNPDESKVVSSTNKFDHVGFNPNLPMRPDFYSHYDFDLLPFDHPNSLPRPFPVRGPPKRRRRPKKKKPQTSQSPFLPPPQFSMPDGPYAHEIPHYDLVGPRLPLPRHFNMESPPLLNPLRSSDHGIIDHQFPSNPVDFKLNVPHFKDQPIYFRPLPPGYIIKCKTNLFFSVFTRRLCYPLPFNPTHVGW